MANCTCCRRPLAITDALRVRPMIYPDLYAMIGECPTCSSTQSWVIFETPDEAPLLDGELLQTYDHLSDLREAV